uniref:Integrase catalytic domain-containing protein n=1 Tax=Tanacetum cinerariifolium TaxID=118510 RepID=A0A6L2M7M9_TANCI|nr:hypothetical protein [Tanacetum cinerariifolium]
MKLLKKNQAQHQQVRALLKKGRTVVVTTEDMQKRRNDVKERTSLLLALPNEHHLRFSKYKTSQELWDAILKTFGGNEATKKTKKNQLKQQYGKFKVEGSKTLEQTFNRLQAIISHLEFMDIEIEQDDLNQKFLTSLALEWLMHTIVWRNKSNLDTMSLDDLYNHLKFGKEEVNTASILTASTQVSPASANIDEDDIEKMDIKWNMPLLSMRADRFWKKTGKQISIQGTNVAAFDRLKVECFNCHKIGYFAREYRAPRSQNRGRRENYRQGSKVEELAPKALMAINEVGWDWSYMANEDKNHALVADEEALTEYALMTKTSSENETGESASTISSKLVINFVKAVDRPIEIKTNKVETIKKRAVKYAKLYIKTSKSANVRGQRIIILIQMTGNISYLSDYEPFDGGYVSFGQGGCKITGKGTIKIDKLEFENAYFLKDLKYNLFNVSQICDNKNSVLFTNSECIVLGRDFKLKDDTNVLLRTHRQHNMYSIDLNNIVPHKDLTCLVAKASLDESIIWHRRLGHLNFKTMNKLVRHNLVKGLPSKYFKNDHIYTACLKEKQHKVSCKSNLENSVSKPIHTLHMDLFGPTSVSSLNHKWYCLVVTDDFSRNKEMNDFCSIKGIKREFSNARTPQQNRVVERRNKTLIEAARTILADAKLLVTFWAKAVNTGCYVQNRVLVNKSQNKTPYELFNVVIAGKSSSNFLGTKDAVSQDVRKDMSSLRFVALPNWFHEAHLESSPEPSSDTRIISKRVISQDETPSLDNITTLANRFEDILRVTTTTIDTNRVEADVSNMETTITASHTPTLKINKDHPKSQIIGLVDTPIQTRNKSKDKEEQSFIATIHQKTTLDLLHLYLFSCFLSQKEPKEISDALKDPRVRPIGTKWVLKNKKDERRIVIRNKSMLVAQGHTQEEGIDYKEVFAPVARIEAIRLFLAYASFMRFTVYQMDVKSAFLYGTIDEEVYDKNVGDILKKFKYSDVRSANTPIDKENSWGKDGPGKDVELHLYRSMIGSLMYLTASRSYIMFAVCACARHQVTPKECHLHAVKRTFRYLKCHPKLGLWYPRESPIDLTIVATSTTKAEYVAAASGCGQVLWIQNQLLDYGHHFIRDCFEKKLISVDHIHTDDNVADLLTKPFDAGRSHTAKTFDLVWKRLGGAYGNLFLMGYTGSQWIKTTDAETKILATVDSKPKTISESSIRRNLKLNDKAGISSLPDAELFKNLTLMGSNIATAVVCLATNRVYNFSKMIFDGIVRNVNNKGEGSRTPTKPHHTPSPEAPQSPQHDLSSSSLPPVITKTIPTIIPTDTPPPRQYTRRARIAYVPSAVEVATVSVPTGSGMVRTASPIFTSASVVTPYSRRKGKEKMVETDTPKKKKLQEQIDIQLAREIEEQMMREDQRISEQIAKDAEIARIHAEEELQMLIDRLDRKNEVIARHLHDYEQASTDLSIGEKIKLINELVKYQDHHIKILKQATSDKEKELWVELKRLYEPDVEDQLWTHTQAMMYAPVEWKLYDSCGVHHMVSKDQEIFMLVEKDYLLRKGLAIVIISIPTASDRFPLPDYFPTASEDIFPLLRQRDATAEEVCAADEVKE